MITESKHHLITELNRLPTSDLKDSLLGYRGALRLTCTFCGLTMGHLGLVQIKNSCVEGTYHLTCVPKNRMKGMKMVFRDRLGSYG